MRRFQTAGLIAAALCGLMAAAHAFDDTVLGAQIRMFERMTALGSRCSERLDVDGKNAVSGGVCGEYTEKFYAQWRSREDLIAQTNELVAPYQNGEKECTGPCAGLLVHVDQLKTTVIYYLDYIDFLRDM